MNWLDLGTRIINLGCVREIEVKHKEQHGQGTTTIKLIFINGKSIELNELHSLAVLTFMRDKGWIHRLGS
jgi:hypothetical protein